MYNFKSYQCGYFSLKLYFFVVLLKGNQERLYGCNFFTSKSRRVEYCPNVIGTTIKAIIHVWYSLPEVKGIASEINLANYCLKETQSNLIKELSHTQKMINYWKSTNLKSTAVTKSWNIWKISSITLFLATSKYHLISVTYLFSSRLYG